MAAQDFSFTNNKTSDPAKRQAVLSLEGDKDIECLSKVLKELHYHIVGKSHQPGEIVEVLRKYRDGIFFIDNDIAKLASGDFLSKTKTNCPNFKIVMLANKMEKQQVEDAKKNGVVGFLAKPLTADAIKKLLSKTIFN